MIQLVPVLLLALSLGSSEVNLAVHEGGPGLRMLVLHDDENTAAEVGAVFVAMHGGTLVEVRAQGERRVTFEVDGTVYDFDPNRIFTRRGIRTTLDTRAEAPNAAVRAFADELLDAYTPEGVVLTLHNNTEGNYSAASYASGGPYERDALYVHLEPGTDPDDFFFVTSRVHYEALKERGFNVVLQANDTVTDDGSLSVYAAQMGWPYVNVEAQHGHGAEQRRMLEALAEVLAQE